jgi:hypothetical protein
MLWGTPNRRGRRAWARRRCPAAEGWKGSNQKRPAGHGRRALSRARLFGTPHGVPLTSAPFNPIHPLPSAPLHNPHTMIPSASEGQPLAVTFSHVTSHASRSRMQAFPVAPGGPFCRWPEGRPGRWRWPRPRRPGRWPPGRGGAVGASGGSPCQPSAVPLPDSAGGPHPTNPRVKHNWSNPVGPQMFCPGRTAPNPKQMHGALWVRKCGQISVAPPSIGKEVPMRSHLPLVIANKGKP